MEAQLFDTDVGLQGGERLAESEERLPAETHEADGGGEARSQNKRGEAQVLLVGVCVAMAAARS